MSTFDLNNISTTYKQCWPLTFHISHFMNTIDNIEFLIAGVFYVMNGGH